MFFKRKTDPEPETVTIYKESRTGHIIGSKYDPAAPVPDQWNRAGDCSKCRKEAYCSKECRAAKDKRLLLDKIRNTSATARGGVSGAEALLGKVTGEATIV